MTYELCCVVLGVYAFFVTAFAVFTYIFKGKKLKALPSLSAQQILHDLTTEGRTILKIERIAPEDIFLRSPRDR